MIIDGVTVCPWIVKSDEGFGILGFGLEVIE